ncbi:hypothetical protein R1flu_003904 [Riccia fluitans]|uniref:Uncharacterized protein n=1 Tax=Riccia fluitans TaxID=41844 RepID=A0ABD1Y4Y0_9MARC
MLVTARDPGESVRRRQPMAFNVRAVGLPLTRCRLLRCYAGTGMIAASPPSFTTWRPTESLQHLHGLEGSRVLWSSAAGTSIASSCGFESSQVPTEAYYRIGGSRQSATNRRVGGFYEVTRMRESPGGLLCCRQALVRKRPERPN